MQERKTGSEGKITIIYFSQNEKRGSMDFSTEPDGQPTAPSAFSHFHYPDS
jgi:hypothetical protein